MTTASPRGHAHGQELEAEAMPSGLTAAVQRGSEWVTFFDGLEPRSTLHDAEASVFVTSLASQVRLRRDQRVLDFGCGFGFVAALLAGRVSEVWIWDASARMRAAAARRTAQFTNVRSVDAQALLTSPPVPAYHSRFDLILVNSVAQYMLLDELSAWLSRWKQMLAVDGAIVMSDLIAPGHRAAADLVDLLRLGARRGMPVRSLGDALTAAVRYARVRRLAPLTQVGPSDLARLAGGAGLRCEPLRSNLTHFRLRWSALLRAE